MQSSLPIKVTVDDSELKALLQSLAAFSSKMGGATKAGFEQTANEAKKAAEKIIAEKQHVASASLSAEERIAKSAQHAAQLEEHYSKVKTKQLITDIKEIQDKKTTATNAMKLAVLEGDKAEAAGIKKTIELYDQELRQMKQIAMERKEVQKGGAGASVGILGTGRQVAKGGDGGGSGMLGGVAGGIGFGAAIAGMRALKEHAKEADSANDQLRTGLSATGISGEKLNQMVTALSPGIKRMSNDYAISSEQVKAAMGQMAATSGLSGKALQDATEDAIVLAQSRGEEIGSVVKIMGKATNEEIEGSASKLGIALDKSLSVEERQKVLHAAAMKRAAELKKAADDGTGGMDRIFNKLQETFGAVAMSLLDKLMPIFTEVINLLGDPEDEESLLHACIEIIEIAADSLIPIVIELAHVIHQLMPVINFIIREALAPLVKWLGGFLGDAINKTIELVKEAIKIIGSIASVVGKVLGFSASDAKAATHETHVAVKAEQKDAFAGLEQDKDSHDKAMLAKQQKAGKEHAKQAKTDAKSRFDAEKSALEEALSEKKNLISIERSKGDISEIQQKTQELAVEHEHAEKMLAVLQRYHQKVSSAKAQLYKIESDQRENNRSQLIADTKDDEEDLITALEHRAAKIDMTEEQVAKETARIHKQSLQTQLLILVEGSKEWLAVKKEIDKDKLDEEKAASKLRTEAIKALNAAKKENAKTGGEEEAERERYNQALEANAELLKVQGTGQQLAEELEQEHQNKLKAIRDKADKERVKTSEDNAKVLGEGLAAVLMINSRKEVDTENASYQKALKNDKLSKDQRLDLEKEHGKKLQDIEDAKRDKQRAAIAAEIKQIWSVAAAKVVGEAIATIPFPANIAVGIAAGFAVNELSEQIAKLFVHAEGGVSMVPELFPMAGKGNWGLRGEAGPELHVPLNKYPGVKSWMNGDPMSAVVERLDRIDKTFRERPAPSILDNRLFDISQKGYLGRQRDASLT